MKCLIGHKCVICHKIFLSISPSFIMKLTNLLSTLRSQIEEYTCLLILRKFSTLPAVIWASPFINIQENLKLFCFFTYSNEKFSTLPAVIRASPLIKFRKEFQSTLLLEPPLVLETQEYQNWKLHLVFASLSKSLMTWPHLRYNDILENHILLQFRPNLSKQIET